MKRVMLRSSLLVLSLLFIVNAVLADGQSPHKFVAKATQDAVSQLHKNKEAIDSNPALLKTIITDYILPHMDFVAMAKLVLKSNWGKATQTQRDLFTQEFKNLLVRTYAKSLGEYSSEEIEFLPYEPGGNPDKIALIQSKVNRSAGESISIDYRVRYKESDGWKVYDISIEGVSLVKNYQGAFAREISQSGIDHLIKSLQEKNEQSDMPGKR